MDYIIIDAEDLQAYGAVECGDVAAVQRELLNKLKNGRTPRVFIEVPFDVKITVKEGSIGETTKSKAKPDKVARRQGDKPLRSGDEGPIDEPDEGHGPSGDDSSPGN